MTNQQSIYEVPAQVSEGFWSFKGHYFGKLQINSTSIQFTGYRRNFLLKKIPLSVTIDRSALKSISLQGSRIVKIIANDGNIRIFMIGRGSTNEYGAQQAGYMISTTVANNVGGDLYQIARSQDNEKLLTDLLYKLKNSEYAGLLTSPTIEGVKTSTLFKASIISQVVFRLAVGAVILVAVLLALRKATSMLN